MNWDEHILLTSIVKNKKFVKKDLASINEELFTIPLYNTLAKRAFSLYRKKGKFPSLKLLITDDAISEEVKRKFKAKEIKRRKLEKHDETLNLPYNLEEFRSVLSKVKFNSSKNNLITLQNDLTERLKNIKSEIDLSKLISTVESSIININNISKSSSNIYRLNKKLINQLFKKFGKQIESNFFLPTGYSGFDDVNIGIPQDSFFLLAGPSGSGKSSLMVDMSLNMKKLGARVCIIPYEMSIESNLLRIGANVTNTDLTDIVKNYKYYEKDLIKEVSRFLYDKEGIACVDFYDPELGETIDVVLTKLIPLKYDIIFVDYINLVPFMGGDNTTEAIALSRASKFAKAFTSKTGTRISYLAQFDDNEKRIRYSRAMQEDASNFWYWEQSLDEIKELGYVKIKQKKARNQNPRPFKLKVDLAKCKYYNYDKEDEELEYKAKKKIKKKSEPMDGFDEIPKEDEY